MANEEWRCYHCGKLFTDRVLAAEHFGERTSPRPAACEGLLIAIAEAFEREGIHRNFHNAASVKLLAAMWRDRCSHLYDLLDDISTASDVAKSDDKLYRELVGKIQLRKSEVAYSTDGKNLTWVSEWPTPPVP